MYLPVSINPWQGPKDMSSQMLQLRFCWLSSQDTGARLDSVSHSRPSRWGKPCSRRDHVRRYDQIRGLLRWVSHPFQRHTPPMLKSINILSTPATKSLKSRSTITSASSQISASAYWVCFASPQSCAQSASQPTTSRYHTGSINSGCGDGSNVLLRE